MEFEGLRRNRKHINLTPLIDIVFLLLVYFMLTAHFIQDMSLDLALPKASSSTPFEDQEVIEVVLDKSGRIILNKKVINPAELDDALFQELRHHSKKQVILRGDQAAKLGITVRVMDAARKAGATSLDIIAEQP